MELNFMTRLKHSWNAFMNRDPTYSSFRDIGMSSSFRPDRPRLTRGNERTIITAIYNRIATDVSGININHCRVDGNGRFVEIINSSLNNCLTLEANTDQTGRAFIQDVVISILDEGYVAMVPVDTTIDPALSGSYEIDSMRTGKILEWYPQHVKVRVYNEKTGQREDIILPKASVAIIENPFYAVFNEQNSTMQRLIRKLNILDIVDEQSSAGKLDLIIQLPYVTRSDTRRQEAQRRRKEMEDQLMNSKYGVAYADSSEKIIQLNRSLDNNLMKQIEYLTNMLYSQLGITQAILDGSANEQELLNYNNRLIEPIVSAIVDEMKRKFLTKTARSQLQTIKFFRDPFKLVPINNIADIADKFTRNEILTSNEIRQIIGMKPSNDPKADQLINSNLNQPEDTMNQPVDGEEMEENPKNYDQPEEQQESTSQDEDVSIMDMPISQLPNYV